ncbi:hypothetical protein J416_04466 [Gracilibacillus halophilus YIM-C55.5]|uniref:Uncharacterized protein n=1 Tax=Gracilibacillus halophilus YIM-C55.5 TaxID=1308866 RepID=N4WBG4_9BACI|nr:anti-sigma-F factor Fin family protein [Gracilibacillus halophilus]ENH97623.1 hypothetical protein J416_04466 [Gracilibacillus halophilus YIM-C55.5]
MTLVYTCKHCGGEVGRINPTEINAERLGWNVLSTEERQKLMQYQPDQSINFEVICESCQQILEQNPEYHELDHFIQ